MPTYEELIQQDINENEKRYEDRVKAMLAAPELQAYRVALDQAAQTFINSQSSVDDIVIEQLRIANAAVLAVENADIVQEALNRVRQGA